MTFKVWKLILLCGILAHCHLFVTSQWGFTSLHECPPDSDFLWPCPSTQQPDKSLVCIHSNWTCDQDIDCPEGEDEQNCPDSGYCDDGQSCKDDPTMCIPSSWICDGDLDCDDGSDEPKSNCSHLQNLIPCLPNEYRCPGTRKCIPLSYVCDNKDDCDAGIDENNCFDNKCSGDNIKCENCVETVDGPICYCPGGYQWNETTSSCLDINECEFDQYCDQPSKCTNSEGSFSCSCVDGYQLEGVTTCKAVNVPETLEPSILLANHWDIRQFNLDGSNLNPPFVTVGERVATLDFYHQRNKVCWITHHGNYGNASLLCGPVDRSQISKIENIPVKIHLPTVDSFAIDWVAGNWYFTDPVLKRIVVCSLKGDKCVAIVTEVKDTIKGPKSIVLNPLKGNFYFADQGGEGDSNIFMAYLTGSDLQSIVSTKIIKPGALCIDYANEHLYFADMALNHIHRVNLDGTNRRLIAIGKAVENVYGISVLENFLYVSDRHNFQILQIHRYNYTMSPKILVGNLSQPGQLHIYSRVRQPVADGGNACSGAGCDHICTLDKDLKPVCLCAVGYQLTGTKKCTRISDDSCGTEPLECDLEVGERHCSQDCTLELCPAKHAYCPSDEACVPTHWWCDEKVDCSAGEDEGIHCRYDECLSTEFTCQSGQCIDLGYICDGNYDCGALDHSDEINCEKKFDCDEENLFACNSTGKCISYLFVCDGSFDCEDESDEKNCEDDFTKWMVCHKETEFACRNGEECINLDWKCDGEEDCVDGSDESDCDDDKMHCHEGERACETGNRCIPKDWFCDREPDCLDRSDESDKNCPEANFTCFSPYHKCDDEKGIRLCLGPDRLCDEKFDCQDHSDEGDLCASKKCNSTQSPCSDICYNSPSDPGYICDCPLLMKLDSSKTKCIEAWAVEDICKQWGICGQSCKPDGSSPHGYRCTCFDGYFLEPDRFTCKPQESHPVYVVFSNRHEIRRVNTANNDSVSLLTGLRNTIALDFYYEGGKPVLFWTDVMEDKIYRGTMQGNSLINVEAVIEVGLATTEGLAIDWVGKNIYWVESNLDQIEVAKLDGSNRTTLIAGNMVSPRAIVVDPRMGALFWTDWDGHNPRIEGCSMSGEERKVIHQIIPAEGGGWPNGLTVDYDFFRLYWIDARSESIHSITYNGLDHRLIIRGHEDMSHPFAMSLFGNYVYWTDWSSNAVVRANKFNGSNVQKVQQTITQPFDLQVIHPKRQPSWAFDKPNGCTENNGGCSDLCLLNYNQTVSCRCPHRKKLDADRKTCIPDEKFLLFVKNNEIRGVDVEHAHFSVIPVITVPHVDKPTSIDYDTTTSTLYWADKGLNVINRANITDGSVVETLIDSGLSNPEGFAIDWLSGNMYFSSYDLTAKTASISVATLSGSYRTELIFRNITQPKSIALHPKKGLMFFVDKDGEKSKLCRAHMDGFELSDIVKNLDEPISLSVDFSDDKLYFINSGNNSIIKCDLNGQNCQPLVASEIKSPKALTVYENHIYVSDTDKIVYINKDGSEFKELRNSTPDVNALLLYDKSQRQATENDCVTKKSHCSQLCLPKSEILSQCKCTAGYKLKSDRRSCEGIRSFLLYAKETEIRGHLFETNQSTQALAPISKILSASAIDFHAESDYIYWVDTKANTISRIKRDLTKREVIIKDGINSVEGLAVDWIAGNIYWTDAGHSIIEMAKLNGLNRYIIASGDMEKPRSIVVHPELGYLYWSDWGLDSRIERANLDGSERAQYIYTNLAKPWGLTIDYRSHYLYWCDMELRKIEAVNLLFYKRIVVIAEAGVQPVSVTVFNQHIYWIDGYEDGKILKAKSDVVNAKVGSAHVTTIQTNLGPNLKDIKAFDRSRQLGTNLCSAANGGCESLCFYRSDNQIRCACSFGKLDADKKSCTNYDGFILYSKVTGMESINLRDGNNPNAPHEPFQNETHLRNVIGLSFDYESKRIFFSDIQRGDIQFVHFNKTNFTTIVEGIGSAEGIAYESVQGNLFWTSYTNSCISKINVENALKNKALKPDVVIQMSKLDHPRAVVVDSCQKFLFWTNWNNEKPRIQRSNLQGFESRDVITKDILTPNGLTIDHKARKLYWSDARLDKIERCDMDGSNRIVIITSIPQHSFGLAVYEDNLFWTDWMLRAVIRANKYDGTGIVWLRKNLERQPMGIVAIANDSQDCSVNECHDNKYGCQDLCLTDEQGKPYCFCTHGNLAADGRSCNAGYNCSSVGYEAFTCLNGYCLRFEKSCNGIVDCIDGYDENPKVCVNRTCPLSGMFSCANRTQGQCIPMSKQCDGILDCLDGSDESSCPCPPGQFRCKNGMCIPKIYRCNGIRECFDGSDEMVCGDICKKGEFACNGSNPRVDCIPEEKVCDHRDDCGDNSDEQNCDYKPQSTCDGNMFQCDSGSCISMSWRCDRDNDCPDDNSDETNCNYTCKPGQHKCPAPGNNCIQESWVCDGNDDCGDNSDEVNCEDKHCTDDQFACSDSDGRCISKKWVCDMEVDCPHGEDEDPKNKNASTGVIMKCRNEGPIICEEGEFECANGLCIDQSFYCDTDDDCGDNSDEPKTCDFDDCAEDQFLCKDGYCISLSLRCDGKNDCADKSDEFNCTHESPCGDETKFLCRNNVCIDANLTCNGRNDCGDHSDEVSSCNVNECDVYSPCSHICVEKKIGYQCKCYEGFQLSENNRTCVDIDECKTQYPCSQFCFNTVGSYYCKCAENYKLEPMFGTCTLSDQEEEPYLLVSNRYYIRKVNFTTGVDTILLSGLMHSVAIDFDYEGQMLYWTDIQSQNSFIYRAPLNSTDKTEKTSSDAQILHSSTVLNPDGIAVDWIGRNLYWCDRNTDTIEVSKLDGRFRKIIMKDKMFLREPRALEVFPKRGYIFLSDWGDSPHISRVAMDGSTWEKIVTDEIAWPNALTIDYITEKLFWADANFDYIAMADLDGKNRHVVISDNLPHTFAMTTFTDFIFWTDWETNSVYRARKNSGDKRIAFTSMIHRPMDLVVYHSLRQTKMDPNPCEAKSCSHLCLLRPAGETVEAVCACPEHHKLNNETQTCEANCTSSQFLCVKSSKCIQLWWKCDNSSDCDDGSDELNCNVTYHCSQPGMFQCTNATGAADCIPPIGICDGTPQCADGSDETYLNNCTDYTCLPHQFKCKKDNKCIPDNKKCDNKSDCSDGSDEKECEPKECLQSQFKCNSTKCIPYLWQCDGDNDCGDWSDEQECSNRTCIDDYFKCNKSGKCIPKAWECDGEDDCGAGDSSDEDEKRCSENTCDPTYFRCQNSHCIPGRWRCDNDRDCSDGSDEVNCPKPECSESQWMCADQKLCIQKMAVCDGRLDCRDNSDESNCTTDTKQCSPLEFQCTTMHSCIPKSWRCDHDKDCIDGSDEENCSELSCDDGEFRCGNESKCMSLMWQCDGEEDCKDGSDERVTTCSRLACPVGRFRCSMDHTCIPLHKKCNGIKDCKNGEDESKGYCAIGKCRDNEYKCNNGWQCIHTSKLCDSVADCVDDGDGDDGDDEADDLCLQNTTNECGMLQKFCKGNCTHYSKLQKDICTCETGYRLADDGFTCEMVDLCAEWGVCSHKCKTSSHNKAVCYCDENFIPVGKGHKGCEAKGNYSTVLLIAEEDQLIKHLLKNYTIHEGTSSVAHESKKITSIDVDVSSPDGSWLLFAVYTHSRKIVKVSLSMEDNVATKTAKSKDKDNGNNPTESNQRKKRDVFQLKTNGEQSLVSGLLEPQGIAVDWIGKHIYWTDAASKRIEMMEYMVAEPRRRTVYRGQLKDPFSIVVNPVIGKIFWTDRGYPPKIASANLDGTGYKVIVDTFLSWPCGLAIDYHNERLYWADAKSHTVETAKYDGSDRHIVRTFDKSDPPYMLDVYEDYLYVSTYKQHKVMKFSKFYKESADDTQYLKDASLFVGDVVTYQIQKQNLTLEKGACISNPCPSKTQMCINNPAGTSQKYSCVCPDSAIFDGHNCAFVVCNRTFCKNGGNCSVTQNLEFKCSCPPGYYGKQCEDSVCDAYCYNGGICSVGVGDGNPTCKCGNLFSGKRCEIYKCAGYCKNGGICTMVQGEPKCLFCAPGYTGERCETELPQNCENYCENGGTCSIVDGYRKCSCKSQYKGERCEQCGLQDSTTYCANNGICTYLNQNPVCSCKPGFDNRTNCERKTCEGYCLNNAPCLMMKNSLYCKCNPGYVGDRCETAVKDCSTIMCLNGGNCTIGNTMDQSQVQCECPPGFGGARCEIINPTFKCPDFCLNGGSCDKSANGELKCVCSKYYMGRQCEICKCVGGRCKQDLYTGNTTCECDNNTMEGDLCEKSICRTWCYNDAECVNCQLHTYNSLATAGQCEKCICKPGFEGPRCHLRRISPQGPPSSMLVPIVVSVVLAILVLLGIIFIVIIKKQRGGQFRHSRLKDGANLEVSNPVYMPQTTEDDEDESRQPLDQPYDFDPEKSTNFANPIYEQYYTHKDSRQELLKRDDSDDEDLPKNKL